MRRDRPRKELEEPSLVQVQSELRRMRRRNEYRKTLRGTIDVLIVVAAIAILVATMFLPVLQVCGTSMEPTLESGQIVLAIKNADFERGDIVAFYYNNKILLKRVIGNSGDWIKISEDGTVYVNDQELDEPYLTEKSLGQCDITFPYQVPDGRIFVLGDHRATSVDSRTTAIGSIADEFIVGKVEFRVWPLNRIGRIR